MAYVTIFRMHTLNERYVKPFGVSVLLLAIALIALLFFTKIPEQAVPIAVPVLQQYTPYHGATSTITFQYPVAYHLEEIDESTPERKRYAVTLMEDTAENEAVRGGTSIPREGPITITITSYQNDLDNTPLATWVTGTLDSNWKLGDGTYASTTVGGIPALSYDWDGLYRGHTIAVAYGGYIHAFTVTSMERTDHILTVFDELMETVTFGVPELE